MPWSTSSALASGAPIPEWAKWQLVRNVATSVPTAQGSATALMPIILGGGVAGAPTMQGSASMLVPGIGVAEAVPAMAGTAAALAPSVSGGAVLAAPVATASGAAFVPAALGAIVAVAPPTAAAAASMLAPLLSISEGVAAPVATANAQMIAPELSLDLNLTAPAAAASSQMLAPTVTVKNNPAYGSVGAGNYGSSNFSWMQNITGNALLVDVAYYGSSSSPSLTVTVGGQTLTLLDSIEFYSAGIFPTYYEVLLTYGLLDPPTGSQTVSVSGSWAATGANSTSYANVGSFGTAVTNSGSGTTASLTVPSATGQMVHAAMASGGSSGSFSNFSPTQRFSQAVVSGNTKSYVIGDAPGGESVAFSASLSSASWGAVGIPLLAQ
ncbi:hypothetical protein C1Y40_04634 [Mycobacterium talmoniae]|uniref:Minor tail protein n=1 Tax=Mycobacterium talmoniae TaxID=1858794 RepID=A0A2S8BF02_9MYCO|nr:hypothetical protein C1Y40_04634 [Mycobacterium talmoniae]